MKYQIARVDGSTQTITPPWVKPFAILFFSGLAAFFGIMGFLGGEPVFGGIISLMMAIIAVGVFASNRKQLRT